MKLKKIASLALAGVMAVSMLTACGNTVSEQPTQPEQPTNPATGYSTMVGNNLSAAAKSKVTMSDSSDLDAALKSAMDYVAGSSIAGAYFLDKIPTLSYVGYVAGGDADVYNNSMLLKAKTDLIDNMKAENKAGNSIGNAFALLNPYAYNNYNVTADDDDRKDDDRNVTLMYVIDGAVGYDAVMKQVASDLDAQINGLKTDYRGEANTNIGAGDKTLTLDYNYVVSVSADTITLTADHGKSITVVAVNVARNLGE